MTIYLRQSTASQEVLLGPFVDSTDGNTAETALSIANTDIKLWLAGATTLANKNSGGATHISNGNYYAVLDATDTATLGSGAIVVQVAGALAFRMPFTVLTAQVYDSLIAGSDLLDISMTQILGTAVSSPATAGILDVNVKNIDNDAASASGTVTFPNATLASTTNISAGTITTATNVTTVNGLAAAVITAASIAADAITDAKVAADVTIASVTGAVGSVTGAVGSVTGAVGSVTGAVGSVTGAVGSVTGNVGGNVTGSVGSVATGGITASSIAADAIGASELAADAATEIATAVWAAATRSLTALGFTLAASDLAADTITAAKVAADVTTEIQTGLATAANLATLTGYVDTEVAAIKAVTDLLPNGGALTSLATAANLATVAGYIDTEIAAIITTLGTIPTAAQNADALLDRTISGGANGGRDVTSALRALRNKQTIVAGTLTVYAEDDTTSAWTAAVATTAGDPISSVDPA